MKILLLCSGLAWLAPLAVVAPLQEDPPRELAPPGSLRRLAPDEELRDPNRLEDLFARDFDRELWRKRLTQADLDAREKSYEALLRRARLDPIARAFLEELAREPSGGELAWTARLALRELGRARFPLQAPPGAPFALEPFMGDPLGGMQQMQRLMDELLSQGGPGLGLPHGLPSSGRSVEVEQLNGRTALRITDTVDGREVTRRFEGASLAEILAAHPELEGELGGLRLEGGRGLPGRRLGEPALPLEPQERSRPLYTDRLGVVVQPLPVARKRELGLEGGLLVERSVPGSYAGLLGVAGGDVLLELDGLPLRSEADIELRMKERQPEDALTLVWIDALGQRREKTWRAPAPKKPR